MSGGEVSDFRIPETQGAGLPTYLELFEQRSPIAHSTVAVAFRTRLKCLPGTADPLYDSRVKASLETTNGSDYKQS